MAVRKGLTKDKHTAAIAWAANQAGISYGKMMLTLTEKQKQKIYADYQAELNRKEKEMRSWIKEEGKTK